MSYETVPTAPVGAVAVPETRLINTTTPLTGGGDLSADLTLALADTTVIPGVYTNTDLTVDAQGRITAASNGTSGGGSGVVVNVKDAPYSAAGDWDPITSTGTDDTTAIQSAIDAAIALGAVELYIPPGNYHIAHFLDVADAVGLRITGGGALYYESDDTGVVAGGVATSDNIARSCLFMRYCRNVKIMGPSFHGKTSPSFDLVNLGVAIYETHCQYTKIVDVDGYDGNAYHQQDATVDTTSTGDSIAVSAGVCTLTDADGLFRTSHVGLTVTITGATNIKNDGVFRIVSRLSSTQIQYINAAGTAETSSLNWTIDDGDRGTMIVRGKVERMRAPITLPSHSKVLGTTFKQPMTPDLGGIVTSFSISATTVTMRSTHGTWGPEVVGKYVLVSNSTTSGNDGLYQITAATKKSRYAAASMTYTNAAGATELGTTTSCWWIAGGEKVGIGAGTSAISVTAGVATITSSVASFTSSDIGKVIRIAGGTASSGANNQAAIITACPSSTTVTFSSTTAVNENWSGVWSIDGWDAAGPAGAAFGSAPAIYIFAGSDPVRGREDYEIAGCMFLGIRKDCIKVSGSGTPLSNVRIHHNTAIECGGLTALGADDSQEHSVFAVHDNTLIDCGTGRAGWSEAVGIFMLGGRGFQVDRNTFLYTRPAISKVDGRDSVTGQIGIQAAQYVAGNSQPVEDFSADGNKFIIDYRTTRPGMTLAYGVAIANVGLIAKYATMTTGVFAKSGSTMTLTDATAAFSLDLDGASIQIVNASDAGNDCTATVLTVLSASTLTYINAGGVNNASSAGTYRIQPATNKRGSNCSIHNTKNNGAASVTVQIQNCVGPDVYGTMWSNAAGVEESGSLTPRIAGGRLTSRNTSSASMQISTTTSWPLVFDNSMTANGNTLNGLQYYGVGVGLGVGNYTPVDHPLLGKTGRVKANGGRGELVFAYGSGHVDGDTITVGGVAFTYKASGPSGHQFNSAATLISAMNTALNGGGLTAEDYGSTFATPITTGHIRVRLTNPNVTVGTIDVDTINILNPTALVIPRNATAGGEGILYSVAEGGVGPVGDKVPIWTPYASPYSVVTLVPDNEDARVLTQANYYRHIKAVTAPVNDNSGCVDVMYTGVHSAGALEEWRWSIQ